MPDFDNQPNDSETTAAVEVRVNYEYLRLSEDLKSRLRAIQENSRVAAVVLHLAERVSSCVPDLVNNINFLGVSVDDPTKISYLNFGRIVSAYSNGQGHRIWEDKNYRYHSSAGKVVRKLFDSIYVNALQPNLGALLCLIDEELIHRNGHRSTEVVHDTIGKLFTETDYDQFNNLFRVEGFRQGDGAEVVYVKGHWIQELYLEQNYASLSGSLGNSCMRYTRTNKYLEIYAKNPSICKLAVILNQEGKVQARALVWTVEGKDYYDRIYAASDLIQDRMKAFFLVNGIDTCYNGYSGFKTVNIIEDPNNKDFDKRVLLSFDKYPYMDSLKYLDSSRNNLSNSDFNMEAGEYCILNGTDGNYEEVGSHLTECYCCGCETHVDDIIHIDFRRDDNYGENLCSTCGVYSEYHSAYITARDCVEINDDYVLPAYTRVDYTGMHIISENAVELVDGRYADHDDDNLAEYDDGDAFILNNSAYQYVEYDGAYYKPEYCVETKDGEMVPTELTTEYEGKVWLTTELDSHLNLNLI
jgi:hypothetical protein